MAYTTFVAGTEALASDINTYLMNQTVMVFANAAARDAALTSPTEGMVTYQEGSNHLTVYTGTEWVTFDTAWTTYTPTFTNFTLGNGTVTAQYFKVGKMVTVQVAVTLGTTSAVSGLIGVSLPVAFASADRFVGYARGSVVINYIMHVIGVGAIMNLYAISTSGAYAATTNTSATIPNTWANTHKFFITATYEVA
jgi:hypothetical protein